MRIIAKVYFSEQLKPGDAYELPEADARLLIVAGLAEAAPTDSAKPVARRAQAYGRRDLQAAAV